MRPLRIVYVIGYYAELTGSQRSLLALLRGLPSEEVAPLVVFPGEGRCVDAFREAGVPTTVLPAPDALDRFGGVILAAPWREKVDLALHHTARYARAFARLLARERADIAHFNDLRALLLAGAGAWIRPTPRIWHVRGDGRSIGAGWHAGAFLANRTIGVADAVCATLPTWAQPRSRTVYNGIDADDAGEAHDARSRSVLLGGVSPALRRDSAELLVVMVASLVPFKGAHHLIDALGLLERDAPTTADRVVLVHVGDTPDPPYRAAVEDRIRALKRVQVRFVGWDERPLDWMRAADLVVQPTVERETLRLGDESVGVEGTEGFPRAVLEAMTCARPVVATRVMGIPEQIEDGVTGALCAPSSPAALAESLRHVLGLPPEVRRRMGEAGFARVRSQFSTRQAAVGTLAVYRELSPPTRRC